MQACATVFYDKFYVCHFDFENTIYVHVDVIGHPRMMIIET
jgi:hypothetical protein